MQKIGFTLGMAMRRLGAMIVICILAPEVAAASPLSHQSGRGFINISFFAGGVIVKLSAWSLWLSSSLLLLAHGALAQTFADSARYLTDDELKNPEFVVNWLKTKSGGADRKMADWYFKNGMKDMQRKYCSGASKNFAESMIRYPSPQTLIASADATICMLVAIRARTKSVEQHKQSDLKSVDGFYRSALAADGVLKTLSAAEKTQARKNADCLSVFVKSGEVQENCPPLQAYGLNK